MVQRRILALLVLLVEVLLASSAGIVGIVLLSRPPVIGWSELGNRTRTGFSCFCEMGRMTPPVRTRVVVRTQGTGFGALKVS